jgi:Zn ribbon nucleic-acid-binding protein
MSNSFAVGKIAIAECDRCGFRYKLKQLKALVIKTKNINMLVCPECWEQDHPQLQLGMYPVFDPQALRNPRPDRSYIASGLLASGYPGEGSRDIQWGWAPVGGSRFFDVSLTPNNLVATTQVGTVTISVT